ncbi:SDR family NAD(P)-dependent oxidoreductase [Ancylobacter polymorphus]|uniref:Glucose 1-dehydrogenase n=1 Tax=Ancylobacter polymorphus TaxID=223390 RepID=A0A9E7ABN1_9HYPH|nr:glucose 1-dehydrogenase [Ancylobacter polymorphus]UOK73308.1 glucose 1-dehydrogenase [Ancylobacter polymorphus]
MRLAGKVAIITGAAGGQGVAEARAFAEEGAAVVLTDLRADAGEELAASIRAAGGRAQYFQHDVVDEGQWRHVVDETRKLFGGVHVLVNNAGTISRLSIEKTDIASWDRTMAVNLTGPMLGMKVAAPAMRDSGGGSIVNVSSTAGLMPHHDAAYTASKWGLRGLSKTAAIEFVEWNIRVNSIHPAQIAETGFVREGLPGHAESACQIIPMQRLGTPQECADLVLFLASDQSSYITGAEIAIDGGFSSGATQWVRTRLRRDIAAQNKG